MFIILFTFFSSILHENEIAEFDFWLVNFTQLELSSDWVGFNVPDTFWNEYNRPSIVSMIISKSKLLPLNFSELETRHVFNLKSDETKPFFIDDIAITNPQILPVLHYFPSLLASQIPIFLYGPYDSGKSSFLKILFNNQDSYFPCTLR